MPYLQIGLSYLIMLFCLDDLRSPKLASESCPARYNLARLGAPWVNQVQCNKKIYIGELMTVCKKFVP